MICSYQYLTTNFALGLGTRRSDSVLVSQKIITVNAIIQLCVLCPTQLSLHQGRDVALSFALELTYKVSDIRFVLLVIYQIIGYL